LWEGAEGTSPFPENPVSAACPTTDAGEGFKLSGTQNATGVIKAH